MDSNLFPSMTTTKIYQQLHDNKIINASKNIVNTFYGYPYENEKFQGEGNVCIDLILSLGGPKRVEFGLNMIDKLPASDHYYVIGEY